MVKKGQAVFLLSPLLSPEGKVSVTTAKEVARTQKVETGESAASIAVTR